MKLKKSERKAIVKFLESLSYNDLCMLAGCCIRWAVEKNK